MRTYARRGAGRPFRAGRAGAVLVASLLGLALPAEAATSHAIDRVNLYASGGFVHGSAWFKDTGPGRSWVHTWIDTYSGETGQLTGSLGHRSGVTTCRSGSTCYVLLVTSVQAQPGECYVARAISGRGRDLVEDRAPPFDTFCV